MTWLVFGVSCLLVLAGAVSVISGAPIIQLERGWAEVIAGTVALSSGGIVFALAAILMRLEAVREAIAMRTGSAWQPALAPVAEERADPIPLPAAPVQPPEVSASAETVTELVSNEPASEPPAEEVSERHGLWKRVRRPEPQVATAMPSEPDHPSISSDIGPSEPAVDRTSPVFTEPSAPAEPPAPSLAPASDIGPVAAEDRQEEQSLGWLDRSLFRARSKPVEPREAAPLPAPDASEHTTAPTPSRTEPSLAGGAPAVIAAAPSDTDYAPAISNATELSHAPAEIHEEAPPSDEVTVIGRYQAGVASYIMYSDGTIQVETEGGELHRFASMDELKAYIASQDNPVA